MTGTLGPLIVDADDPVALAAFWADVLGAPQQQRRLLRFRRQDRVKTVKNRVHLDVRVDDPALLIARGARLLAEHLPGWVVLADIEGNEFCAFPTPGAAPTVFAVCTDSDRPEELAAWWAGLVGARVDDGPDGTPRWLRGASGWEELIWKFVRVDDPRTGPNRWLPSVIADAQTLADAGARRCGPGHWLDPQSNDFSAAPPATSAG